MKKKPSTPASPPPGHKPKKPKPYNGAGQGAVPLSFP